MHDPCYPPCFTFVSFIILSHYFETPLNSIISLNALKFSKIALPSPLKTPIIIFSDDPDEKIFKEVLV